MTFALSMFFRLIILYKNKLQTNTIWQGSLCIFFKAKNLCRFTLLLFLLFNQVSLCIAQRLRCDNLLAAVNLPAKKLTPYLFKNGFVFKGKSYEGDTVLNEFQCKPFPQKDKITPPYRYFCQRQINHSSILIYQTSSVIEFQELINSFKTNGFLNDAPISMVPFEPAVLQYQNLKVSTSFIEKDTIKKYCLQLETDVLPLAKNLHYADDLLAFSSEECLKFYFGKENVVTDEYYFFDKEVVRCSVLFINTQRQVVYIWQDEKNKCTIRQLLFGGEQRLESAKGNNNYIAENIWKCKSGLQAGMPLMQLRKLNGTDFKFQSGFSPYFGAILPDTTGKINFKKQHVVLGCMNCKDQKFLSSSVISADDAIAGEKILFILSVVLIPNETSQK